MYKRQRQHILISTKSSIPPFYFEYLNELLNFLAFLVFNYPEKADEFILQSNIVSIVSFNSSLKNLLEQVKQKFLSHFATKQSSFEILQHLIYNRTKVVVDVDIAVPHNLSLIHIFVIGQVFLGFAMSAAGSICLTYAVDSYHNVASESLVLMLFIRNMIGMGFTFAIQPWLVSNGLKTVTWLMFMLSIVINGSFIFMIKYGKSMRRWTATRYEKYSDLNYGELFPRK